MPLNTRLSKVAQREHVQAAGTRLTVTAPLTGAEADVELRTDPDPDAPHTVLFTSGTTSRPKAVELTLANHAASARASNSNLGNQPDDAWLCVLPLFHVGGLAILLRSAVNATTAVLHDGFRAGRVRDELEGGGVTVVSLVPTMLHRLREIGFEGAPALRAVLLGGGPMPSGLLDWARDRAIPIVPSYGMTETASQVATPDGPLAGVDLRITADGEILVRGPMVARGSLASDGWLHTGDLGTLDSEGRLRVEGRRADLIVTGGENVMAGEVEEALRAHPAVADAGVRGFEDEEWGERVVAFVVRAGEVSQDELIEACRARLGAYKAPKEVRFVVELPRTASGKLIRARLG